MHLFEVKCYTFGIPYMTESPYFATYYNTKPHPKPQRIKQYGKVCIFHWTYNDIVNLFY